MLLTPKPAAIGLTTRKDAVSWLIRLGQFINRDQNAEYSHAFLVINDNTVAEATIKGFVYSPREKYDNTNTIYLDIDLTPEQRAGVLHQAGRLIGTKYSIWSYFLMLALRVGIRPKWLQKRVASNKELICSASCDLAYSRAGVHLFDDGRIAGEVTPADLVSVIIKRKWQPGYYNNDIIE